MSSVPCITMPPPRPMRAACDCAKFSATSSVCMNSLTLMGLVRYWKKPALRPLSMSRGTALALSATTGMCAVAGSSARMPSAWTTDTGQIDVHQDDIRQRGTGDLDATAGVGCGQQVDIGPACDEIFDQHQIRRVVLDIEQRAQPRRASPCPGRSPPQCSRCRMVAAWSSGSARSRTHCPCRPCSPRR